MTNKCTCTAFLTSEASESWHEIYPDGEVPIASPLPSLAELGDSKEEVYTVALERLTTDQRRELVGRLAARFNAKPEDIADDIGTKGLPLRKSQVSSVAFCPLHTRMMT